MKIALGSDHAGFSYKEKIAQWLLAEGHDVADLGTHSPDPVDYPVWIRPVALAVARGDFERGVILGGSGNGEAIVANRVVGVRCAVCWNPESAKLARAHNDANIISFGERLLPWEIIPELLRIFLNTPFEGGRHIRRLRLIDFPRASD